MMDKDPVIERLATDIATTIGRYTKGLLSQGFELPMQVAQMAGGAHVISRYFTNEQTGKLDGQTLHKDWPEGTKPFPLYLLYVDRAGRAHLAVLAAKGDIKPLLPDSGIVH